MQALYEAAEPKKGLREAPLDPNHTHFILVDDGTQHKYGAEIQLRAALEKEISNMEECGGKQCGHVLTDSVSLSASISLSLFLFPRLSLYVWFCHE